MSGSELCEQHAILLQNSRNLPCRRIRYVNRSSPSKGQRGHVPSFVYDRLDFSNIQKRALELDKVHAHVLTWRLTSLETVAYRMRRACMLSG